MYKIIVLCLSFALISWCARVQEKPQEAINTINTQIQQLIEENQTIQQWTTAYNENKQKIEELQAQIQAYQIQLQELQEKSQELQNQAIEAKEKAEDYGEKGSSWITTISEKIQSLR